MLGQERILRLLTRELSGEGAVKYAWALDDQEVIESVLLEHQNMTCACVSTQVGCPLDCVFCASGSQDFVRNLTAREIGAQIEGMAKDVGNSSKPGTFDRILLMGVGEPLMNYNSVLKAILTVFRQLCPASEIMLATSGVVPDRIRRLARDAPFVRLWISLPGVKESVRKKLSPSLSCAVGELLSAGECHAKMTSQPVRVNYIMIREFTDTPSSAQSLSRILRGRPFELQLSKLSPLSHHPELRSPSEEVIARFAESVEAQGVPTTIFRSRGVNVGGACGQLRARFPSGDSAEGRTKL